MSNRDNNKKKKRKKKKPKKRKKPSKSKKKPKKRKKKKLTKQNIVIGIFIFIIIISGVIYLFLGDNSEKNNNNDQTINNKNVNDIVSKHYEEIKQLEDYKVSYNFKRYSGGDLLTNETLIYKKRGETNYVQSKLIREDEEMGIKIEWEDGDSEMRFYDRYQVNSEGNRTTSNPENVDISVTEYNNDKLNKGLLRTRTTYDDNLSNILYQVQLPESEQSINLQKIEETEFNGENVNVYNIQVEHQEITNYNGELYINPSGLIVYQKINRYDLEMTYEVTK